MALLKRRWEQAKHGEGRVVLISGEPGIGKSRLTAALSEHIEAEPHTRLRYFCSPYHQNSALYPVIAQLERAAGFDRDDGPEAKLDKLRMLLGPVANTDDISWLRRDQGRHAVARDLLAVKYGWFTEGFDTADLIEAKALIDELA